MATKKNDLDFTNQKQATTAEDVEGQDARTRLWQSLNYTYGKQREESDKQYAQAVASADRQALGRGMQRSSYNAQNLANLRQKGVEANNNIYAAQIADYQNRIGEIEQQEKEDERWERQFAEGQRQFNENLGLQREQFGETKAQNEWGRNFQQNQADISQEQWNKQFEANRADTAWSQQFQTGQFEYQKQRDTVSDEQWQKQYDESLRQFNEQMAYQRERSKVSDAQWEKEYNEKLRQFNEQMAENKRQFDLNYNEGVRQFNEKLAADASASAGNSHSNGVDTRKPWERLGISEEQYYILFPDQRPKGENTDLFETPKSGKGGRYVPSSSAMI